MEVSLKELEKILSEKAERDKEWEELEIEEVIPVKTPVKPCRK